MCQGQNKQPEIFNVSQSRTAALWIQYMETIDILRSFMKAERKGYCDLHLRCIEAMLPYFAASGHNLYTKCTRIYLQEMKKLQKDESPVYTAFKNGFHVIRRSDRFWAGLSSYLVIESVLMRSLKATGGLTRGRGMSETQRLVWLLSMPITAEVKNAMQQLTRAGLVHIILWSLVCLSLYFKPAHFELK